MKSFWNRTLCEIFSKNSYSSACIKFQDGRCTTSIYLFMLQAKMTSFRKSTDGGSIESMVSISSFIIVRHHFVLHQFSPSCDAVNTSAPRVTPNFASKTVSTANAASSRIAIAAPSSCEFIYNWTGRYKNECTLSSTRRYVIGLHGGNGNQNKTDKSDGGLHCLSTLEETETFEYTEWFRSSKQQRSHRLNRLEGRNCVDVMRRQFMEKV